MRLSHCVGALVLAGFAAFASATPDQELKRTLAVATANLERGGEMLADTSKLHSNAERLQTLDRALYFLRRARSLAVVGEPQFDTVRAEASQSVVRALDDEADIYYWRRSLWLARNRVDEALAIDRLDPRARNLDAMIATAATTDVYANNIGASAVERVRERRAAAGLPLRDRGIGFRR